MIEITWRYDPSNPVPEYQPQTPGEAIAMLAEGNAAFASLGSEGHGSHVVPVVAYDLGLSGETGSAPPQEPEVALLACADARVPPELVFLQSANDMFVVRVAGNVLGSECVGSLDYAISHLPGLRLLATLGHTGCGAVAEAVACLLEPARYLGLSHELPLRAVVDSLMATANGVRAAMLEVHGAQVQDRPGYRAALIDATSVLNAALGADALRTMFGDRLSEHLGVACGVYDLASRRVGMPLSPDEAWTPGLIEPPQSADFPAFVTRVCESAHVRAKLAGVPSGSAEAAH